MAVGVAEAQKRLNEIDNKNRIVICQFGDGAMEEGFYRINKLRIIKKLPILFACEDNGLAIHTYKSARTPINSYENRISAFGMNTSSFTYKSPKKSFRRDCLCYETK